MNQTVAVSVIVPVYNGEVYLAECLESILSQTLSAIEILCIDDGSTDNSRAILEAYAVRDGRLRILSQQNRGAGVARNVGMEQATGEYLAFLDADDVFAPDMLEKAYAAAGHEADLVLFNAEFFSGRDTLTEDRVQMHFLPRLPFAPEEIPERVFQAASCNTWNKLYRRTFVLEQNLRYQALKTANDLFFVSMAMATAKKITAVDEVLVRHRMRSAGNLQSVKNQSPLDFFEALKAARAYLTARGLWEQSEKSFLNFALIHFSFQTQTLNPVAKKTVFAHKREIYSFLGFDRHPAAYYYDANEYTRLYYLTVEPGGQMQKGNLMNRFRFLIKQIFPPPTRTFLREMNDLRQQIESLSRKNEARQEEILKLQEELLRQQQELAAAQKALQRQLEQIEKTGSRTDDPVSQ